jgi:tRNA modification GTPase
MSGERETCVACLTPAGKSALATIEVLGPRAWEAVHALFRPIRGGTLPEQPEEGRFWFGRIGEGMSEEAVLAVRRVAPQPLIDIHAHGGREVVRFLLETVRARGVVEIPWEEMLRRGEADALRGEAAVMLARATTARTAGILLDQYRGAFDAFVKQVREEIEAGRREHARELLREVLRHEDVGRHLNAPWRVVIAGAPNVGKSSLVNALAGYQRSLVAPTPGTTRDAVTVQLAIDGWPVEVIDTAGLRSGGETLEALGMEQARLAAAQADLVLWLLDASQPPQRPAEVGSKVRLVVNKVDLPAAWDLADAGDALRISAATGEGVSELVAAVGAWLVPEAPPAGAAVPFTPAWIERLEEAERLLGGNGDEGTQARLRGCLAVEG